MTGTDTEVVMVTFSRSRPGKPARAPASPDQVRVQHRIVEMMANAGLRTSVIHPLANGFDITVTREGHYTPLFTVHGAFYRDHAAGCVRRPDENPSTASAPLFLVRPSAATVPPERTFLTRSTRDDAFEPLLRLAAIEAASYAPPILDETGLDGTERDLLDAMRMTVAETGASALLGRLHEFLVERARDSNDPTLLEDALAALNGTSPGPKPR